MKLASMEARETKRRAFSKGGTEKERRRISVLATGEKISWGEGQRVRHDDKEIRKKKSATFILSEEPE